MIIDSRVEWDKFKNAFSLSLEAAAKSRLIQAWESVTSKTAFYNSFFMDDVATRTSYKLVREKFRCDYALLNDENIPIAFIEAENAHPTAWREISNLCCFTSPLKILVLSCEWQESEKSRFLPRWQEIIKKHHSCLPFDCIYAMIVGEWGCAGDDDFHYYYTAMDSNTTTIDDGEWII